MEYVLSGTGFGEQPRTVATRESAVKQFNRFLNTKEMSEYDELEEEQVLNLRLWQEFGTFLKIQKLPTGAPWTPGCATTYLSQFKTRVKKDYPSNALWKDEEWYKKIYQDVEKSLKRARTEAGLPIVEKTPPLGREIVLTILRHLLSQNTIDSMMQRAYIIQSWLAMGRTGECALTSFNQMYWDKDSEAIVCDWSEIKNSRSKLCSFFVEYEHYEMCFYHSIGCYLICNGSELYDPEGCNWVFPLLANSSQPSKKVAVWFQKWREEIVQLYEDATATGLRSGSTTYLGSQTDIPIHMIIVRGNWDMSSSCNIWEYLLCQLQMVHAPGRALSGWPNPKGGAFAPTLPEGPPFNTVLFQNFMHELFSVSASQFRKDLIQFQQSIAASLFMHLEQMLSDYGEAHLIPKRIFEAGMQFRFKRSDILHWGQKIKQSWIVANTQFSAQSMSSDDFKTLHNQNVILQQRVHKLESSIEDLKSMLQEQFAVIRSLLPAKRVAGELQTGQVTFDSPYSSPKRQKKSQDDAQDVTHADSKSSDSSLDELITDVPQTLAEASDSSDVPAKLSVLAFELSTEFTTFWRGIGDFKRNSSEIVCTRSTSIDQDRRRMDLIVRFSLHWLKDFKLPPAPKIDDPNYSHTDDKIAKLCNEAQNFIHAKILHFEMEAGVKKAAPSGKGRKFGTTLSSFANRIEVMMGKKYKDKMGTLMFPGDDKLLQTQLLFSKQQ
jgi:hypothetical protein